MNALLASNDWNPDDLNSPLQHLIPPPKNNIDERKFEKALPTAVKVTTNKSGQVDWYIDDLMTVAVDVDNNWKRGSAAVLTAIQILGCPVDKDGPIKIVDLVSLSKLIAEASMDEWNILLGWKLDTRSQLVSLAFEEYRALTDGINNIIACRH